MKNFVYENIPVPFRNKRQSCLSCGIPLSSRRKRYCSTDCRQTLAAYLNRRTGLLVALNTWHATFYFTDYVIVMDILPYGSTNVFSFILPRTPGQKPVDDYCEMSDWLGTAWWNEKHRTKKRYKASLYILDKAKRTNAPFNTVIPKKLYVPAVKSTDLKVLALSRPELVSDGLPFRIKKAYRQQAKKHHPDRGGDAKKFRNLQIAYEKIIQWSKNPTFVSMSGFPDKWHYERYTNRWSQPKPMKRLYS